MADDKTVQGLGPLPKKRPRYRIVGRRPRVIEADALRVKRLQAAMVSRDLSFPGFTERDSELAATRVVLTGANLRPAGLDVPITTTKRRIYYPFSVVKIKAKQRGVRF